MPFKQVIFEMEGGIFYMYKVSHGTRIRQFIDKFVPTTLYMSVIFAFCVAPLLGKSG